MTRPFRLPAAAGAVFVVLQLASTAAAGGGPPDGAAPAARVIAHYGGHQAGYLLSDYLFAVSVLFLLVFVAGLSHALAGTAVRSVPATAVLAGGIGAATMMLVDAAVESTLAYTAAGIDSPATVAALFRLSAAVFALMWVPLCLMVAAASAPPGALPRWLRLGGLGTAVVLAAAPAYMFSGSGTAALIVAVAYLLLLAWTAAVSAVLYRLPPQD